MCKRLFQWLPTLFLGVRKAVISFVAISVILLFFLFFMGNEHTSARTLKLVQPSLLTTGANTSTRSSNQLALQIFARPTIRLKPTSGFVGTSTTIVGDHFSSKEVIYVSSATWLIARTKTDSKGHFVLSFHVPTLSIPGFNLVKAFSANKKQVASALFRVVAPLPSASLSPNHGLPGARITIKGKNFTHRGRIIILFIDPNSIISSVGITVGNITASASGTINVRFTVPHGLKIRHLYKIQLLDIRAEHSVSFNFTVK